MNTFTGRSCERIGVAPKARAWSLRSPTASKWPVLGEETRVARCLPETEVPRLFLDWEKDWCEGVNLANAFQIVRHCAETPLFAGVGPFSVRVEWPNGVDLVKGTATDFVAAFSVLDAETQAYVQRLQFGNAIAWLRVAVSKVFPGNEYEISVLPADDGEEAMLAVRVYGAMPAAEFREKRHALCQAMLNAGHRGLYEVVSIFQRRARSSGLQVLSYYSAVFEH